MLSLILLGSYLDHGVDVWLGMTLAASAMTSQVVTSFIFMARLPLLDKAYLACAQQNGITAVILSLLFMRAAAEVIPVVVVAIIVINLAHVVAFYLLDEYAGPRRSAVSPDDRVAFAQPPLREPSFGQDRDGEPKREQTRVGR
jgi:hypothetical protein